MGVLSKLHLIQDTDGIICRILGIFKNVMSHANLTFTRLLVKIFFLKRCLDKYKVLITQETKV
jgi:hypothetical protein